MTKLVTTRKDADDAWRTFVVDGLLPARVRPEILRSWTRARCDWRVDPRLAASPRVLAAADVAARAEAEEPFREAAPLVAEFARRLADDGHVVAYFDAAGVMLALDGSHRSRDRLADVDFAPGACWAESAAGTNGPGTALAEGRPVEVFAAEHFVEAWQPWTCASAPVRLAGAIVGAVDITSPWEKHDPALLVTAEALARAVEARIELAAARRAGSALVAVACDALGARDAFLSAASHEIRTPLTPLHLNIQRLRRLAERTGASMDPAWIAGMLRRAERDVGRVVEALEALAEAGPAESPAVALAQASD
jgi:transcriptional regulator of acetoin/glycerol metabolism